jgi:hypothetical protein
MTTRGGDDPLLWTAFTRIITIDLVPFSYLSPPVNLRMLPEMWVIPLYASARSDFWCRDSLQLSGVGIPYSFTNRQIRFSTSS